MNTVRSIGLWFANLPGGRRSKFAIVGVWLVILFAIGPLAGKFEDAQENDPADYLPAKAESVEGDRGARGVPLGRHRRRDHRLHREAASRPRTRRRSRRPRDASTRSAARASGETSAADRLRGRQLGAADHADHGRGRHQRGRRAARRRHRRHQGDCSRTRPRGSRRRSPAPPASPPTRSTSSTRSTARCSTPPRARPDPADHHLPQPDLLADPVLLGDPRRGHARAAIGYLLAEAGVTVTGQSGGILPVLVFGAGTDYALLLVSRYREELRRHEDKHDAVRVAMRKAGPAIVASARHRDGRAADPDARRGHRHRRPRPDRRPRRRPGDGLDADHPPGAARDHRPAGLLALHPALRQRGRRRDRTGLEPDRRLGIGRGPRRVWIGTLARCCSSASASRSSTAT